MYCIEEHMPRALKTGTGKSTLKCGYSEIGAVKDKRNIVNKGCLPYCNILEFK